MKPQAGHGTVDHDRRRYVHGNFTEVVWSSGVTEGGSSGGALVTLDPGGGFYEVRGGLFGGHLGLHLPHSPDYYSDFDNRRCR